MSTRREKHPLLAIKGISASFLFYYMLLQYHDIIKSPFCPFHFVHHRIPEIKKSGEIYLRATTNRLQKSLSSSRINYTERVTQSTTEPSDPSWAAWEEGVLLINTVDANLAVKILQTIRFKPVTRQKKTRWAETGRGRAQHVVWRGLVTKRTQLNLNILTTDWNSALVRHQRCNTSRVSVQRWLSKAEKVGGPLCKRPFLRRNLRQTVK